LIQRERVDNRILSTKIREEFALVS
jgi:hypothetical protein